MITYLHKPSDNISFFVADYYPSLSKNLPVKNSAHRPTGLNHLEEDQCLIAIDCSVTHSLFSGQTNDNANARKEFVSLRNENVAITHTDNSIKRQLLYDETVNNCNDQNILLDTERSTSNEASEYQITLAMSRDLSRSISHDQRLSNAGTKIINGDKQYHEFGQRKTGTGTTAGDNALFESPKTSTLSPISVAGGTRRSSMPSAIDTGSRYLTPVKLKGLKLPDKRPSSPGLITDLPVIVQANDLPVIVQANVAAGDEKHVRETFSHHGLDYKRTDNYRTFKDAKESANCKENISDLGSCDKNRKNSSECNTKNSNHKSPYNSDSGTNKSGSNKDISCNLQPYADTGDDDGIKEPKITLHGTVVSNDDKIHIDKTIIGKSSDRNNNGPTLMQTIDNTEVHKSCEQPLCSDADNVKKLNDGGGLNKPRLQPKPDRDTIQVKLENNARLRRAISLTEPRVTQSLKMTEPGYMSRNSIDYCLPLASKKSSDTVTSLPADGQYRAVLISKQLSVATLVDVPFDEQIVQTTESAAQIIVSATSDQPSLSSSYPANQIKVLSNLVNPTITSSDNKITSSDNKINSIKTPSTAVTEPTTTPFDNKINSIITSSVTIVEPITTSSGNIINSIKTSSITVAETVTTSSDNKINSIKTLSITVAEPITTLSNANAINPMITASSTFISPEIETVVDVSSKSSNLKNEESNKQEVFVRTQERSPPKLETYRSLSNTFDSRQNWSAVRNSPFHQTVNTLSPGPETINKDKQIFKTLPNKSRTIQQQTQLTNTSRHYPFQQVQLRNTTTHPQEISRCKYALL